MPRKAGGGGLVVGSNKLKDWKGQMPVRVIRMITAFAAYYNKKNNLTGDDKVTEGDVVSSALLTGFGEDEEFMKKFEAGEFDGDGEPASAPGGGASKRAAGDK
jgi:hypothetical protein